MQEAEERKKKLADREAKNLKYQEGEKKIREETLKAQIEERRGIFAEKAHKKKLELQEQQAKSRAAAKMAQVEREKNEKLKKEQYDAKVESQF